LSLVALAAACRQTRPESDGARESAVIEATVERRDRGALTREIEDVLNAVKTADAGQLSVSEEDGRFLRVLVAASGAKSVLEIGGASGYSAIWLGLGARESGGRVVSIEYDEARAKEAAANLRRAGLTDVVRPVHGDAFAEIPKLEGAFDLVFLDAWKPDYQKFFDLVYPRLRPGGLFVAHNVVNKKDDMRPFLETIHGHPGLFTTVVSPSSEGMAVSYKLVNGE
jgi:predicted O-methyltransferase YrrM